MTKQELIELAKRWAEREPTHEESEAFEALIKKKEAEFRLQSKQMAIDEEWLNRTYDI